MSTAARVDPRHPVLLGSLRVALSATLFAGLILIGALVGVATVTMAPDTPTSTVSALVP